MLPTDFALFALSAGAASPGPGPTGAPTGLSSETYGTPKRVRYTWTVTDANAYTRIYHEAGVCPGTPPLARTVTPGLTFWETGDLDSGAPYRAQIAHYRNGQESAKTSCYQHSSLVV